MASGSKESRRSQGSKVGRLVRYFREADLDEARVVLDLAERAIAERLKPQPSAARRAKRPAAPARRPAVVAESASVIVGGPQQQ